MADYQQRLSSQDAATSKQPTPDVSIVTVVWNGAAHLQDAIDSVKLQEFDGLLEYIVIDGGSTDGTIDILRANQAHIDHWISEPDDGIYDAMNKGIALARGKLIKLLNADDLLTENSVATALRLHKQHGAACILRSDLQVIDVGGVDLKMMGGKRAMNPVGPVSHPTWYVDRTLYETLGLYNTSFRVSADYELFLRLHAERIPFVHSSTVLASFRSGGVSGSMIGVKEQYEIDRTYFGRGVALRYASLRTYRKLRTKALTRLLGERGMYKLRAAIRFPR